jgi:hypothetical protein
VSGIHTKEHATKVSLALIARARPDYYLEVDRGHKTPCWIWQRHVNAKGYPYLTLTLEQGRQKTVRAHRHYYEMEVGVIPIGMTLDHLCEQRSCVRPDHLEPVTQLENVRRGLARRKAAGRPRYER